MKKLLVLTVVLSACFVSVRPAYVDSSANVSHAQRATVAIVTTLNGAPFIFCTGFFIDARTLVTAAHCLKSVDDLGQTTDLGVGDPMRFVTYRQWDGAGLRDGQAPHAAVIQAVDLDHDVALLHTEHYASRDAFETSLEPSVGDRCYAMGHPAGASWTLTAGVVSALRADYVQCSAPLYFGNSGGPVFDDLGRVIGVADAIIRGVPHLALSSYIRYAEAIR